MVSTSSTINQGYGSTDAGGTTVTSDVSLNLDRERQEILEGFRRHMHISKDKTGLLSDQEVRDQERYVREKLQSGDEADIKQLWDDYASAEARQRSQKILSLHESALGQLEKARKGDRRSGYKPIISEESYREWVKWLHDSARDASDKTRSIRGETRDKDDLPSYLSQRWALAEEREKILKNPQLRDAEKIADPKRREMVLALQDDRLYFKTLSFSQRRNLVDTIQSFLPILKGGENYKKLHEDAHKMLLEATKEPQPALHRDKVGEWMKTIFHKGFTYEQMDAFVHGGSAGTDTLKGLIDIWRAVAVEFWTARKADKPGDPFYGVKTNFINTKAFLWKKYPARLAYVNQMKAEAAKVAYLRQAAIARIGRAGKALDTSGKERWLNEYVFNGNFTVDELSHIISGNLNQRLDQKVAVVSRFDKALSQAQKKGGIRGMQLPDRTAFLSQHYDKQLSQVNEIEQRLEEIEKNGPDFLLIRHLMDQQDWDDAGDLISAARKKKPLSAEDEKQLNSMESYLKLHRTHSEKSEKSDVSTLKETQELDDLIDSIDHASIQTMCRYLCERGSEASQAAQWTSYNRDWCNTNGYLDIDRERQAIAEGKTNARIGARSLRRGVVSGTYEGETGKEHLIKLSKSAPTNVCVNVNDSSGMSALTESLYHHRKEKRALYWTNLIFHDGSSPMSLALQNNYTKKMRKMTRLLRKMESKGHTYQYHSKSLVMKGKSSTTKRAAAKTPQYQQAA